MMELEHEILNLNNKTVRGIVKCHLGRVHQFKYNLCVGNIQKKEILYLHALHTLYLPALDEEYEGKKRVHIYSQLSHIFVHTYFGEYTSVYWRYGKVPNENYVQSCRK
jgi:hypothetical protein